MTRSGRRLVEDFLLPALNDGRYGDLLKWVDQEKGHFSIRWSHKNAAKWTLADTIVFQDWDRLKGHYQPQLKGYYMQAKQRFRAALYKISSVTKLKCDDKHVKKYQLHLNPEKKKQDASARSKGRIPKKEEGQKSIPTSVICKHTSLIENHIPVEQVLYPLPEMDKIFKEYTLSQKKQMKSQMESSPIKECNSQMNGYSPNHRVPHLPILPPPTYNLPYPTIDTVQKRHDDNNQKQNDNQESSGDNNQKRHDNKRIESPQIVVVRTYYEVHKGLQSTGDDVGCVFPPEPEEDESKCYKDALNLCMKSDSESR